MRLPLLHPRRAHEGSLWRSLPNVGLVVLASAILGCGELAQSERIVGACVALAGASAAYTWSRRRSAATRAEIVADESGVRRVLGKTTTPLVRFDQPFGVTLLASYGRDVGVLALSTRAATRYVPVQLDDENDELFASIAVIADLDFIDGWMHEPALRAADAANLVRHLIRVSEGARSRVLLTASNGTLLSFDAHSLTLGDQAFDLTAPLEWRPLIFHEAVGQASALYQATWLRQRGREAFLVAPMPASWVPKMRPSSHVLDRTLGRALVKQLSLLQVSSEPPPPRDLRVAIDRPFVTALRRVLESAPLSTRSAPIATKNTASARDSVI